MGKSKDTITVTAHNTCVEIAAKILTPDFMDNVRRMVKSYSLSFNCENIFEKLVGLIKRCDFAIAIIGKGSIMDQDGNLSLFYSREEKPDGGFNHKAKLTILLSHIDENGIKHTGIITTKEITA